MTTDPIEYPFEEFLYHYDDLRRSGRLKEPNIFATVSVARDFFRERFPDDREMVFKCTRFLLILQYVASHLDDFDRDDFAVRGSDAVGALVGTHVLRAVHHLYTTELPASHRDDPSSAEVMRLAREFRQAEST